MRKYRRELSKRIDKTFDEVIPEAERRIEGAFHDAAKAWDVETIKSYKAAGKPVPWERLPVYQNEKGIRSSRLDIDRFRGRTWMELSGPDDDSFFKFNRERLELVIKDVRRDMNTARYAAARRAGAQYEEIIKKADMYFQTGTMTRDQAIEMAAKEAAEQGLNCVEYQLADGGTRRVNVASYVDMALRTSGHRAALTAEGAKRDEWGEYLVVSPGLHSTCDCCLRWQARILIDNVFASGKPDGKHELLSTAIKEGFLHPNCRHPLVTYIEGITQIPKQSPYDKTRRNYEAEQKQRQIELMIRRFKREQAISQTAERAAEADRKIEEWQQKMKDHLADNPQLRRQPQREKLIV